MGLMMASSSVTKYNSRATKIGLIPILLAVTSVVALVLTPLAKGLTGTLTSSQSVPSYTSEFGLSDERTDIVANIYMTDEGELFTASQDLNRVGVFSQSGTFLRKWGGVGLSYGSTAPYEFFGIGDIAQLSNGNVLVFDADNGLVKTFQQDGTFVTQHAVTGGTKLVVDSSDNVYIAESYSIVKYDTSWNIVTSWGSNGSGDGQFSTIWGMGIDSADNVYVSDANLNRIQKFDSDGNYLLQWGTAGSGNGQFNGPDGITSDASNNIFVADWGGDRIQKFDSSGNYLMSFGNSGSGDGQLYRPDDVAVDASGNVYVADTLNYRMVKFDSSGNFLFNFGDQPSKQGQLWHPSTMAIDTNGNRYVADTENHRIQKFDSNNNFVTSWGSFNVADPGFQVPYVIDTDSANNVYVNDVNGRIRKFDSSGNFIYTVTISGSAVYRIGGLAVAPDDTWYVINFTGNTVQHYDSAGNYLGEWGSSGTGDGQFTNPIAMTFDKDSNAYVVDSSLNRVQKFTADGTFLAKWGSSGNGDGQFDLPVDISVTDSGLVYVMDAHNYRVQAFDTSGNFISKWGSYGVGQSQFIEPSGIETDAAGSVYTVDYEQYRVQKFSYVNDSAEVTTTTGGTTACVGVSGGASLVSVNSLSPTDPDISYIYGAIDTVLTPQSSGGTESVRLLFESALAPADVQVYAYDSGTNTSTPLSGYTVTTGSLCGRTGLLITYSVTDGGTNDSDGSVNDSVETVLGVMTSDSVSVSSPGGGSDPGGGSLVNTGMSTILSSAMAISLIVSAYILWRRRYYRYSIRG